MLALFKAKCTAITRTAFFTLDWLSGIKFFAAQRAHGIGQVIILRVFAKVFSVAGIHNCKVSGGAHSALYCNVSVNYVNRVKFVLYNFVIEQTIDMQEGGEGQRFQNWFEFQVVLFLGREDLETYKTSNGDMYVEKTVEKGKRVMFSYSPPSQSYVVSVNKKVLAVARGDNMESLYHLYTVLKRIERKEWDTFESNQPTLECLLDRIKKV